MRHGIRSCDHVPLWEHLVTLYCMILCGPWIPDLRSETFPAVDIHCINYEYPVVLATPKLTLSSVGAAPTSGAQY